MIEITSPEASQGKSTVVANLAVAFSRIGIETIVLDADLRRPRQHEIFGLDNSSGLSTMLALGRKAELKPAGQGLWVITSGPVPPDPTEMLHIRLPSVIKALRRRKALILIDTPPVLPVSDARLVAPLADGVILVATAGTQKPASFQAALDRLALVDSRLMGIILNKAGADDLDAGTLLPLRGDRGDRGAARARSRPPARREPPTRRRASGRRRRRAAADARATGGAGLGARAAARQPRRIPGGGARRHPRGLRRRDVARVHARGARRGRARADRRSCGSSSCCSCWRPRCRGRARSAYPTEAVSVVKILGVLLFMAWLLRAMAALRAAAGEPGARHGPASSSSRSCSRRCSRPTRPTACSTRCATCCSSSSSSSCCSSPTRSRTCRRVVRVFVLSCTAGRRLGPLRLHRARPRTRGRADRGPQRLRLPDGLRAAAGVLPARRGEAPADRCGPPAACCWSRATLATLSRGA